MKKILLQIEGIHCKSCKTLIEEEINLIVGVKEIEVNAISGEASVVFNEKETQKEEIIKAIEHLNYEVRVIKIFKAKKNSGDEKQSEEKSSFSGMFNKKILLAGTILALFAFVYFLFSRFGLFEFMARVNESNLGYGLIFVIGLLASFHCIGMCGGIVMAYTTRFCASVKGNKIISLSHINYNVGRILSYTLTGVFLGGIGSFFGINKTFTGIITLLAGLFMVAVGLSLLARFSILDKITGILPASFARLFSNQLHALNQNGAERAPKFKTPFIIGFLNGFIPCGPLQAMQIYALASGSALTGGLSMAAYGLGTAPLMLGFGSVISLLNQARLKQVMKASGIVVILLGLLTVYRGFGNFGFSTATQIDSPQEKIETQSNSLEQKTNNNKNNNQAGNYQTAKMDLDNQRYVPDTLTVKKGIPVRWVINVKQISGCTAEILLPAFGVDKRLVRGENIIEFTPKVAGTYKFSCGMQMVWGKFIVTE